MRSSNRRGWVRALLIVLQLLVLSGWALAAEKLSPIAVDLPGLGPTLMVGTSARDAVARYVRSVNRRHVFPRSITALRRWEAALTSGGVGFDALPGARRDRPIIGILLNHQDDVLGNAEQQADRRHYAEAVKKAGGIPVFLAPGAPDGHVRRLLSSIDHLLLTGGDDVHPRLYGRSVTWSRGINLKRDRAEQRLIRQAIKMGLGIDGICRGEQILNVTLGGTMTQDIHKEHVATKVHSGGERGPIMHQVVVERASELGRTVGRSRITMKSWHHQAVKKPGRTVKVVARSLDGVPEAIEALDGQIHGYQFHPEKSDGEAAHAIFADIVARARSHARRLTMGR